MKDTAAGQAAARVLSNTPRDMQLKRLLRPAVLYIHEECSLTPAQLFCDLSQKLNTLRALPLPTVSTFGELHLVSLGDFYQKIGRGYTSITLSNPTPDASMLPVFGAHVMEEAYAYHVEGGCLESAGDWFAIKRHEKEHEMPRCSYICICWMCVACVFFL